MNPNTTTPDFLPSLTERIDYWARKYIERGLHVIINHGIKADGSCTCAKGPACTAKGKHPAMGYGWQQKGITDLETFRTAADRIGPDANIGIVTGLGGLVVADFDGPEGMATYCEFAAAHPEAFEGPMVRTGGGSLHVFFRSSERFIGKVKVRPGLDVRCTHNQVVAVPSLHKSGARYSWIGDSFDGPIPELPEWLAEIFREEAGRTPVALDAREWVMNQEVAVEKQDGSKRCMVVTSGLIRKCGVRTVEKYLEVIEPWNDRCMPPWSEQELIHKFESAMAKFLGEATIDLPIDKKGQVVLSLPSLRRIVREDAKYEFAFTYDQLSMKPLFNGEPYNDNALINIRAEIAGRYCLRTVPKSDLDDEIRAAAFERGFHPVVKYLDGLKWDGTKRLATFAAEHLGAKHAIEGVYFWRWTIAAVARAFEPGCKVDDVLILRGDQDICKSTFFQTLAGRDEWFMDSHMDLKNKDSYQQMLTWIIEWGELQTMAKASVETTKQHLSSRIDRFRPPYGRNVEDVKRRCVFVGTTNDDEFLVDPTGDRRFWVIDCTSHRIDLDIVRRDRDQLWAEAVAAYRSGERHYLTQDEKILQREANARFRRRSECYQVALEEIEFLEARPNFQGVIKWSTLLTNVNLRPVVYVSTADIANALKAKGYTKGQSTTGPRERVWIKTQADVQPIAEPDAK